MASFVLDENVDRYAFEDLQRAGFKVEQIGVEVGAGQHYDDERVIQYLHRGKQKTLITHNVNHFYLRRLRHPNYCLLGIEARPAQVGGIAVRVLRLPQFRTKAQRMGKSSAPAPSRSGMWNLALRWSTRLRWIESAP